MRSATRNNFPDISGGQMLENKIITTLRLLEIHDVKPNGLRWFVIHHLESGGELPIHDNKVNLSALAKLAGIDRQLFYPSRGILGFRIIVAKIDDILKNSSEAKQHNRRPYTNKNRDNRLIDSMSAEIIELHEKLARANQIEKMALLGMHIIL